MGRAAGLTTHFGSRFRELFGDSGRRRRPEHRAPDAIDGIEAARVTLQGNGRVTDAARGGQDGGSERPDSPSGSDRGRRRCGDPAMTQWLGDPRLGAFAVRVLERIADERSNRRAVLDALASADMAGLPEGVAQDIEQAIDRLGGTQTHGVTRPRPGPRTQVDQWPGRLARAGYQPSAE